MNNTTSRRCPPTVGERFGHWTVSDPPIFDGRRYQLAPCRCDCGTEANVQISDLRRGKSQSCGCLYYADIQVGTIFGDWAVLSPPFIRPTQRGRTRYVQVRCVCGTEVEMKAKELVKGRRRSCGCRYHRHGAATGGKVTSEYRIWSLMRDRCNNPNNRHFANYGGRGIQVCERWDKSFVDFLADMGERPSFEHTLDRYPDNDGNYEKSNCRWATRKEQNNNKRSNRIIEFDGERLTVAQWAERIGVNESAIRTRLNRGWSTEEAVTLPTEIFRHPLSGRIENSVKSPI